MTDLSPDVEALLDESYESDLTEEESEELLLLCGHGIGPKLSPAAQEVLDAFISKTGEGHRHQSGALAAALRAAANQRNQINVPFSVIDDWEKIKGFCASFYAAAEWGYKQALKDQKAIAAELEGNNG